MYDWIVGEGIAVIILAVCVALIAAVIVNWKPRTALPPSLADFPSGPDIREWLAIDKMNRTAKCPDCRSNMFYPGPTGGDSMNLKCAKCGQCWAWPGAPFSWERIEEVPGVYSATAVRSSEL